MKKPIRKNALVSPRENVQTIAAGRVGQIDNVLPSGEIEVYFPREETVSVTKVQLKIDQVDVLPTMDESMFWRIIEEAKAKSAGDSDRQIQLLIDTLAEMPVIDIFSFDLIFNKMQNLVYRRELWSAGELICGSLSDDSFSDFRAWLVAQGEKVFYDAVRDPDTLVDGREIEELNYLADRAYEKKMGEEMPLFPGSYEYSELLGDWDEAHEKTPKLKALFGEE